MKTIEKRHQNPIKPIKTELPFIVINDCRHYFIQGGNYSNPKFVPFMESDFFTDFCPDTHHPFGCVFAPVMPLDGFLRFVKQKDGSILMFHVNEWNNAKNPFSHAYIPSLRERLKKSPLNIFF